MPEKIPLTETYLMFSVHTKLEEFKNQTIAGHFGFVWERKSYDYCDAILFEKLRFQNVFSSTRKRKADRRFQICTV